MTGDICMVPRWLRLFRNVTTIFSQQHSIRHSKLASTSKERVFLAPNSFSHRGGLYCMLQRRGSSIKPEPAELGLFNTLSRVW